jgi:hypothetical protein
MGLFKVIIVELPDTRVEGEYDVKRQTWSVESAPQRSPQKHHQEN